MKQHVQSQSDEKPTNRLGKFMSLFTKHIIKSSENSLKEITNDILNLKIGDSNVKQNKAFQVKQIEPTKQKPSKMQEVEQFCSSLRQTYNSRVYNKDWVSEFVYNLQEIVKNNAYICVQDAFQTLKQNYCSEHSCSLKQKQISKRFSSKLNPSDTMQFNLQLTIKSRNSKNSSHFDPRDSLTYSNTTSFGLPSSENRSKPTTKNDGSARFLPPNNMPSLKALKSSSNENDTDIPNIPRTQSRGQVSSNSRQTTPNNLIVNKNQSQKILTEDDKDKEIVEVKHEQKISDSRVRLASVNKDQTPVKQDQQPSLVPLTQLKQADEHNQEKIKKKQDTNKNSIKQSPSIEHFSDRKKVSSKSTSKKMKDDSIFANQISHFEERISKIKQAKLAKKLQLQEQLKRINNEIQDLKFEESQQQIINQPSKRQKSQKLIQKQNTFESRIKINDNRDKKLQAISLVRNLRAEKISRENQKRRKIKVLDTDLHSQIEDIMRLKYFNEERVKQKRKLEIIERMKQQQIRKIQEQKRKQQSLQFLAKLKVAERQKELENIQKKLKKSHSKSKFSYSRSQNSGQLFDQNEIASPKEQMFKQSPTINEKKKSYISRKINPSIKRRITEDKYEQLLG